MASLVADTRAMRRTPGHRGGGSPQAVPLPHTGLTRTLNSLQCLLMPVSPDWLTPADWSLIRALFDQLQLLSRASIRGRDPGSTRFPSAVHRDPRAARREHPFS
jgi:hypothetical protein